MKERANRFRSILVLALVLVLASPGIAIAGGGKKAYKKGLEYEQAQRWDLAADQFALALAEDPSNSEYRLHYYRAVTNASLMFTQRGDLLAAQKDYDAAYQSYRMAFTYDPTNELAEKKMKNMLKILGRPEEEPGPETKLIKQNYGQTPKATLQIPPDRRVKTKVSFRSMSLQTAIDSLAESIGLNVIYDVDFKDRANFTFEARDITKAKALELILLTNKLFYAQVDTRAIIVAPDLPQNRARYQDLSVRTFYLRNADVNDVRNLIATVVSTKYLVPNKQLNALTVRDTPANLELIESIIASIDKDRAEVLIDVNLYEVVHSDLLRIGNQFDVSDGRNSAGSLATFIGGVGQEGALRANTPAGLFGPIGLALALPSSALTLFQSKGSARRLASTQVHVLDNEQHTVRIGSRVPIQTAQIAPQTTVVTGDGRNNNNNPNGFIGFQPTTQFQYENVGLNIDLTPVVHEDMVQIKMKIETSDVAQTSGVGGNPIFTQRSMSSVASIRDGQTTLIAGVSQENKGSGRSGLPLISLIPVIGRLFSTPNHTKEATDVVITVTPHILRAPTYTEEDSTPIPAGRTTAPDRQVSIEEIVYRAELEEAGTFNAPPVATKSPPANRTVSPRPKETNIEADLVPGGSVPVRANPGDTIDTPGGPAPRPLVPPEENRPAGVVNSVAPVGESPDDEDDEDDEDEEDPSASLEGQDADGKPRAISLRLAGLRAITSGKPMPVAVWATGDARLTSAAIAIKFDEQLLRVSKVESTGMFDGKLGAPIPFEVQNGMLVINLARPAEMANLPVSGQLLNITFEVLGQGSATLAVVPSQTQLNAVNDEVAVLRVDPPFSFTAR